jgi:hypothetical protein
MTARDISHGLTSDRLRTVLSYDPETGILVWAITLSARRLAGSEAGYVNDQGYRLIGVDGCVYRAHRLAWFYMTGSWPPDQIDHKNGIRDDNRWSNLRAATEQDNKANTRVSRNNKAGVKGVYWNRQRQKWAAKINPNRKQVHLGFFEQIGDAAAAYEAAARKYYGEFGRAA